MTRSTATARRPWISFASVDATNPAAVIWQGGRWGALRGDRCTVKDFRPCPGERVAMDAGVMDALVELSYAKCRELLGGGVLGRVAVCTPEGPRILPVNYSIVNESIVFRTSATGIVATRDWSSPMAFEVDHVDYANHKGWSVVATGGGHRVEDADELAHIKRTWDPRPWAAGTRPLYVRLAWEHLTGRRLGHGWTHAKEMPVRQTLR